MKARAVELTKGEETKTREGISRVVIMERLQKICRQNGTREECYLGKRG